MKLFSSGRSEVIESSLRNVGAMLFTYGLGKTVDYFCTISVFSLD